MFDSKELIPPVFHVLVHPSRYMPNLNECLVVAKKWPERHHLIPDLAFNCLGGLYDLNFLRQLAPETEIQVRGRFLELCIYNFTSHVLKDKYARAQGLGLTFDLRLIQPFNREGRAYQEFLIFAEKNQLPLFSSTVLDDYSSTCPGTWHGIPKSYCPL